MESRGMIGREKEGWREGVIGSWKGRVERGIVERGMMEGEKERRREGDDGEGDGRVERGRR